MLSTIPFLYILYVLWVEIIYAIARSKMQAEGLDETGAAVPAT